MAARPFGIIKMLLDAMTLPFWGCGDGKDEFNSITKQEHRGQIIKEVWSALLCSALLPSVPRAC